MISRKDDKVSQLYINFCVLLTRRFLPNNDPGPDREIFSFPPTSASEYRLVSIQDA